MPYRKPLSSMLADQLFATGSTVDLLKWDSTCLDSMVVPDGIDRKDVINCILEMYGDQTLAHPDPAYMSHYVGTWSERRLPIWTKLLATTQFEYNPIWNFDRTEEYKDRTERAATDETETGSTVTGNETANGTVNRSESSEEKVSAENVTNYQPDNKTENAIDEKNKQTTDNTTTAKGNEKNTSSEKTDFSHSARLFGNIGVTTTQQMIEAERQVVRYTVIEEIAADYRDAFCLSIY